MTWAHIVAAAAPFVKDISVKLTPYLKEIATKATPYLKEIGVAVLVNGAKRLQSWLFSDDKKLVVQEIGQSETFDTQKASVAELKQGFESLNDYKNKALQGANESIKSIANDFENIFEKFGELFKDMDKNLAYDMKRNATRHFDEAIQTLICQISTQISFDNEKLQEILRQTSGEQKAQNLDKFINSINANALRSFQNELEKGLNLAFLLVRKRLTGRLDTIRVMSEQGVSFLQEYQSITDKLGKEKQQITLAKDIAMNLVCLSGIVKEGKDGEV